MVISDELLPSCHARDSGMVKDSDHLFIDNAPRALRFRARIIVAIASCEKRMLFMVWTFYARYHKPIPFQSRWIERYIPFFKPSQR